MPKQTQTPITPRSRRVRRNNLIILILLVIALAALFTSIITRNSNFVTASGKTIRYVCPAGYLKVSGHPYVLEGEGVYYGCVPGVPATRIEE